MEFEKMKEVIANVLNVDPEEITMETTFTEDLGADSLDLFQIIMGLDILQQIHSKLIQAKIHNGNAGGHILNINDFLMQPL